MTNQIRLISAVQCSDSFQSQVEGHLGKIVAGDVRAIRLPFSDARKSLKGLQKTVKAIESL